MRQAVVRICATQRLAAGGAALCRNTVRALVQSYAFQEQPSNSYAKAVGALMFARREEIRSDSRRCRACVDTVRNKVGRQIIIRVPPATWNLECLNLPSPLSLLATNVPQPALHHYRRWLAPVRRGLHGPRPLIRNQVRHEFMLLSSIGGQRRKLSSSIGRFLV